MRCFNCGKTVLLGRSHTHHRGVAGGRWKKRAPKTQRVFRPNLQKATILEDGQKKIVRLCAKCLKRIRKDMKEGARPFLTLVDKFQETITKKQTISNIQAPNI